MTTAYTSLLGLALPVTGELSGTWGDTVNNSITSLLDTSVAGTTNVSTDTDVTLTTTTGAANTARQAILLFSGARTALRTVTAPAQSKIYTVINATTGGFSVKLVGVGPTTGLTIPNGASAVVAWNGSDFVEIGAGSIGNLVVNGTLTVTGATTLQSTLAVTGNITNTAGTANGVAYLNGSKVVTSGSALTFDGTNFATTGSGTLKNLLFSGGTLPAAGNPSIALRSSDNVIYHQSGSANSIVMLDSAQNTMQSIGATAQIWNISNSEQMRLTSTGLGIGTSSPVEKVQSSKGIAATGANQSVGSLNGLVADYSSGASRIFASRNGVASSTLELWTTDSGGAANKNATLDSSGNLGLGVTPSAWGGGVSGLQVKDSTMLAYSGTSGYIGANAYYGTSGGSGFKYYGTGVASLYAQESAVHKWFNAPSGTAGNAITFTQAMTLDASGNWQLGTTTAYNANGFGRHANIRGATNAVLYVGKSDAEGNCLQLGWTATESYVGNITNTPLTFLTNNTERARIDSSGNLAVNTTNTTYGKVNIKATGSQIYSGLTAFSNDGTESFIGLGCTSSVAGISVTYGATGSYLPFVISTGGSERVRIDSSGNFGVGTSSPSTYGRIVSSGGTISLVTDTASQRRLSFWSTANGNSENAYIQVQNDGATTNTGEMLFATKNSGGTLAERARITAAGNFGIGTSSPTQKLVVYDSSTVYSITETGNASAYAIILARNPNNDLYLWNRGDNNTSLLVSTAWDMQIQTSAAKYISFATNNTERGRFDASGNFLVGGTTASGKLTVASSETKAQNATPFVLRSSDASNNFELIFTRSTNTAYRIQSVEQGVGYRDIVMQHDGGSLLVGTTNNASSAKIMCNGTLAVQTSGNGNRSLLVSLVSNENFNGAGTAVYVGRDGATNRSINAGGTVNASGADYAEYMIKAGNFTVAKGDVVGIDAQGKLTNVFANAVSFVVKSTDPSYVGGDTWGVGFDNDAEGLEAARQTVDRIAFAGQVPVNVIGATAGQYIVPVNDNGAIKGVAKNEADLTMSDYIKSVGKVIAIEADGRARIIVKVA